MMSTVNHDSPPKPRGVLKSRSNISDGSRPSKSRKLTHQQTNCGDKPSLPPCRICGDKASGFHYGANTCEACKGFFRRGLANKMQYSCIGNGDCVMTPTCRSCSFCRLKKCIDVGMSKDSIKIGRYTLEKKNRDIDEINHLLNKTPVPSPAYSAINSISQMDDMNHVSPMSIPSPLSVNVPSVSSPYSPEVGQFVTISGKCLGELTSMLPTPPKKSGDKTLISTHTGKVVSALYVEEIDAVKNLQNDIDVLDAVEIYEQTYNENIRDSGNNSVNSGKVMYETTDEKNRNNSNNNDLEVLQRNVEISTSKSTEQSLISDSKPMTTVDVKPAKFCDLCLKISGEKSTSVPNFVPVCYDSKSSEIIRHLSEASQLYNLYTPLLQNLPDMLDKQQQHYNDLQLKMSMFGELQTLSNDEYMSFYRATGIDLEDRLTTVSELSKLLEDGARRLIKFAKAIPRFKDLSFNDQASLIKASRFEYFLLGAFCMMNSELEIGTLPDGRNYSLREVAGVCDYNFMKSMFKFGDKLKRLRLTKDELALLKGICLTFSDRIPLDDPHEVETIQWNLLNVFISMLRHNHSGEKYLYTKVWDRLIELRTLNELNKKFTETLTMEWPEITSCPLILEILTMC